MAKEIYKKLSEVQAELKAPKGQYNSFGKYNYRSCEDILEAVKPILKKHGLVLFLDDSLETQGDRYYIRANAHLVDIESGDDLSISAYAREAAQKKGMDDSQTTGCASSYARKYALNGLFCIDDTKDADTDEYRNVTNNTQSRSNSRNDGGKGNYTKATTQTAKSAPNATKELKTVDDFYEATIEWAKANNAVTLIGPLLEKHFHKKRFQALTYTEAQSFYKNLPALVRQEQQVEDEKLMEGV